MYNPITALLLFFAMLIAALCYVMYLRADCVKNAQTVEIALACEVAVK